MSPKRTLYTDPRESLSPGLTGHIIAAMTFLRFIAFVALAFWVGGLVALGLFAAPSLFVTLQAHDPAAGRELAGAAFGAIFQRFQYFALGAGVLLLVSIGFRAALGPRPRHFKARMLVAAVMLASSAATAFLIAPRIDKIRASTSGAVANLPEQDPQRVAFGRLHGASSGLMLLTIVAGLGLFWKEASD